MNRGGLAGATWELDDRFTAYDPDHLVAANLDAGKMLLRIDGGDPGRSPTLAACARAVGALNDRRMMAMVEPIPYTKDADGRAVWDDDPLQLVKAVGVCAALGGSSAYTWLKIQATADIATVAAMTTQPLLLLGGAPGPDPAATFAAWERALAAADRPRARRRASPALPARRRRRRRRRRAATLVEQAAAGRAGDRCTRGTCRPARRRPAPTCRSSSIRPASAGPTAAWRCASSAPAGHELVTGRARWRCCRCRGRSSSRSSRRRFDARRSGVGVRRGHRLGVPADRRRGAPVERRRRRGGAAVGVGDPSLRSGPRRRRRRLRRGARRRPGDPPGDQLHGARRVRRRRQADVRRAAHARRQLVELPAPPPRRQPGVPGEQRGDLLLPDRARRHHGVRARRASASTARTPPRATST